jgi:hypothetical protein
MAFSPFTISRQNSFRPEDFGKKHPMPMMATGIACWFNCLSSVNFSTLFVTRKDSAGVRIMRYEEPNCGEWRI